jgi:membrane-anchored protein YejM (alkaline phosphatase superfamily)
MYSAAHEGDRNVDVTHAWRQWFDARTAPEQPWFSLLYYDPGNAASETGEKHGGAAHAGRAASCLHAWHQCHRS